MMAHESSLHTNTCVTMADALEDDFATSDVESVEGEVVLEEEEGSGSDSVEMKREKRKEIGGEGQERTEEEQKARKKQKMKENDKKRKAKKSANHAALGSGEVTKMPPDMQADQLLKLIKTCKKFSKMSDLELNEIGIKEGMLLDTTSIKLERKGEMLVEWIKKAMPAIEKSITEVADGKPGKEGQPVLLMVTGNAQRAADLAKLLRELSPTSQENRKKSLQVGKLFARHFKVAEQEAFLKTTACPIAVGTPQRILDLLQGSDEKSASLKLAHLKALVLDASWTDLKMRTVLDNNETKESLSSLLVSSQIQSRLKSSKRDQRAVIALF